ncbi:hypothetical protein EVAR_24134_1 [Eumeta japonica]|uniref:Uncharacterized protein n=1 Tax=Eumeta variegata TaxID=151549 RepID=A0A4C1YSL1_EUMVA|nr:hypothetical protein EVAR_24134_1 [Eumeta japonica]
MFNVTRVDDNTRERGPRYRFSLVCCFENKISMSEYSDEEGTPGSDPVERLSYYKPLGLRAISVAYEDVVVKM